MYEYHPAPLAFPRLLSNRRGVLSALRIDVTPSSPDGIAQISEQPEFSKLADRFPCLVITPPGTVVESPADPAPQSSLILAGCQSITPERIYVTDSLSGSVFGPTVEWLDGDWYLKPPVNPSASQVASRTMALQLVQLVSNDADNRELEAVFRHDPTLSYHLLRLVNSLAVGVNRQVTSFSQAIVILGRQQMRRWLNLMVFAAGKEDQRSSMLLARVTIRARVMEMMARECGWDIAMQEQAFMAGMFSLLDVLFGLPLEAILKDLSLSKELRKGVLNREGPIGELLTLAEFAERGEVESLGTSLDKLEIPHEDFNLKLVPAYNWMLDAVLNQSPLGSSDVEKVRGAL